MKVLFVCTGNTCRSAMAEAIFKTMVRDIEVYSAGFSTFSGEDASNKAIIICSRHDIALASHKTTYINDINVNEMDLVLTATAVHRDKLKEYYPNSNAYTIKEYAGGYDNLDIKDPIGGDYDAYDCCFLEIKEALEKIAEKLGHEKLDNKKAGPVIEADDSSYPNYLSDKAKKS